MASSIYDFRNNSVKTFLLPSASKPQNSLPVSKTSDNKARREKKKYYYKIQARRDFSSLSTSVNANNTPSRVRNGGDWKNISEAIYYNYNKKEDFMKNYSEPWKDKGTSKN